MKTVIPLKQKHTISQSLGPCELLVSENTLVFMNQRVRLEPKVTQVLLALSQRPNAVVTREELINSVWSGRPVTDDAITRCISRLRKAFHEELNAPIKIQTLSKSGYRLEIENATETTQFSKAKFSAILALLGLVAAAIVAAILINLEQPAYQYHREALLVSEQWERYPEFSQNGGLITYSRGQRGIGMAVFVQQFDGTGKLQLTRGDQYDHQPTFSPDGKNIAFARRHSNSCDIVLIPVIGGTETLAGSCGASGVKDLAWTPNGDHLWMVTSEQNLQPGRLKSMKIENGESQDLTPNLALGIDDLAISKNGSVAVSAHFDLGVEDIFVSHLDKLDQWKRVTHQHIKIHGMSWSEDSDRLLFTSNRGGPFELWQLDIAKNTTSHIAKALTGGDALSLHADGHILLERWQQESQVVIAEIRSTSEAILIAAKGVNWDAQFDPSGENLVYVSDRTGSAELWLRNKAQDRQITQYQGPWVMSPRWSPDGQRIVFTVPLDNAFQSQIFDIKQNKLLTDLAEHKSFSPHWSHDGEAMYFGSRRSGSWQIYRKDLNSQKIQQISTNGGKVAQLSEDGEFLYVSKSDSSGLWRLDLSQPQKEQKIIHDLVPVDWNNWRVVKNTIFYVQRRDEKAPILRKFDVHSKDNTAIKELNNFLYFSGINFDGKGNITYAQVTKEDADIDLLKAQKK